MRNVVSVLTDDTPLFRHMTSYMLMVNFGLINTTSVAVVYVVLQMSQNKLCRDSGHSVDVMDICMAVLSGLGPSSDPKVVL